MDRRGQRKGPKLFDDAGVHAAMTLIKDMPTSACPYPERSEKD
jgi:hypothetical protein